MYYTRIVKFANVLSVCVLKWIWSKAIADEQGMAPKGRFFK